MLGNTYGWRARLGLILPSLNVTTEPECYRMLPEGITMPLRARSLLLGSDGVEDPIRMLFSLPRPHPIPIHKITPGD